MPNKAPGAATGAGRLEPPVWVTRLRGPTPVEASRRRDIDAKPGAPQGAAIVGRPGPASGALGSAPAVDGQAVAGPQCCRQEKGPIPTEVRIRSRDLPHLAGEGAQSCTIHTIDLCKISLLPDAGVHTELSKADGAAKASFAITNAL